MNAVTKILSLSVLIILCSAPVANAQQLVGYWTLDDNTDDSSGNGNDGTIMGGVSYDADVPATLGAGTSAAFDGLAGTFINVTQNSNLPLTTGPAFTISMWVKGDGTAQVGGGDERVFSEAMTTDNNPLFNLGTKNDGATGQFDFFFRNGSSTGHLFSTAEPFDNMWHHHLAWVDVDHVGTLYIDGVVDSTYDYAGLVNAGFAPDTTTFGGILRATDCCNYTGNIDDIAAWNIALSADNIASLAAGTPPPMVPEPSTAVLGLLSLLAVFGTRRRR